MQTIKHIYLVPTAIAIAAMMALFGIVFGGVLAFVGIFAGGIASILGKGTIGIVIAGLGVLSIVVFPILFAIIGFVVTAVAALLYNLFAGWFGGVMWDYKGGVLRGLDIISYAKISAAFFGIFALIEGLIMGSLLSMLGIAGALVGAITGLILGMIIGFIFGALGAFLYNVVASCVGGYRFTFKGRGISNLDPISYAKVLAVLSAIYGLIQGVLSMGLSGILASIASSNPAFGSILASSAAGATLGILGLVLIVIANLVSGFITGGLTAIFYNIPADRNIGRIEIDMG